MEFLFLQLSMAMMKKPQRGMEDIWCACGKRAEKEGGDMLGFLWEPPKRKVHENCLDHADIHREVGDLATAATRLATCTDQATPSRPAGKHKLVRKEQRSSHNVTTSNWTKPPHARRRLLRSWQGGHVTLEARGHRGEQLEDPCVMFSV